MLELTLRSTAILAAAWLVARLLTRAAAATRHLVWHARLHRHRRSSGRRTHHANLRAARARCTGCAGVQGVQQVQEVPSARNLSAPPVPLTEALGDRHRCRPTHHKHSRRPGASRHPRHLVRHPRHLGTWHLRHLWLMSLWFAAGWIAAARRVRRALPPPAEWQLEVNGLCEKLRIAREVRLGNHGEPRESPRGGSLARRDSAAAVVGGMERRSAAGRAAARARAHPARRLPRPAADPCRLRALLVQPVGLDVRFTAAFGTRACLRRRWFCAAARRPRPTRRICSTSRASCNLSLRPSAALAMARVAELEGRLLAVLGDRARNPSRGGRWATAIVLALTTLVALGATPATQSAPSAGDRQQAAAESAQSGDANSIGPLREALKDPDPDVREKAALALAFSPGRDVVPALLTALARPRFASA